MFTTKIVAKVNAAMMLLGVTLVGCVAEPAGEEASSMSAPNERLGEAEQALEDVCAPHTTNGGGTWGDVITLCIDSYKHLYVRKWDRSAFTSSGWMTLRSWNNTTPPSRGVSPGQTSVYFGTQPPDLYYAEFQSYAPGTAYTSWLNVQ